MSLDDESIEPGSAYDDLDEGAYALSAIIMTIIQLVIQFSILLWLFFLFWRTFPFRFGMVYMLFKEFPLLLSVAIFNIAFLVGERLTKGYFQIIKSDRDSLHRVYEYWGYRIIFVIRNFLTPIAYGVCLKSSITVGDPDLYKPYKWIKH